MAKAEFTRNVGNVKKASLWDVLLFVMGRTLCWKNKTFTTTVELQRNERMNFYSFKKILGDL